MDLGTWADWANVAGAGLVGGAVIYLGWKANRIADLPRVLALEAERKEAEVLLVFLSGEIASTLVRANELAEWMTHHDRDADFATNKDARSQLATGLIQLDLRSVNAARERLHVLPGPLSHALARATGLQRTLATRSVFARESDATEFVLESEFRDIQKWLNVMITDLEVVNSAADRATRFGA